MKLTPIVVAALAISLQAGTISAQENNRPRSERPQQRASESERERAPGPMMPLMRALDTNKDGALDATEIANASASLLKLDANGDGQLTRDEMRPQPREGRGPSAEGRGEGRPERPQADRDRPREGNPRAEAGRERPMAPPLMAALDKNGDGILNAAEIANAPASLLTLDANGDGILTADELRPQRRAAAGEGRRPDRQGQRPGQNQR